MADLNGDGRVDIVGAAIHRDGQLPQDVAAVWWLEQGLTGWVAHVIKWGSGFLGLGTFNGEKWDQLFPSMWMAMATSISWPTLRR